MRADIAAFAEVPLDVGSDAFNVMRIDSDATHRATALPAGWAGRYVRINVITASTTVDIGASLSASAEVDTSVAPANNSVTTKVGMRLAAGSPVTLKLPDWQSNQTMHLVHEASAANTVFEVALLT